MKARAWTVRNGQDPRAWWTISDAESADVVRVANPGVHLFTGRPHFHVPVWRVLPGGRLADEPDNESGYVSRYYAAELDDSQWYGGARINDVPFGYPTWESDSCEGYLWYRAVIEAPAVTGDEPVQLMFGSPAELRRVDWRLFVDGELVAACSGGVLATSLAAGSRGHQLLSIPGRHQLAIQQRVAAPARDGSRRREAEGWRRVDSHCYQHISWGSLWSEVADWSDDRADLAGCLTSETGLALEYEARFAAGVLEITATVHNRRAGRVAISHVELASVTWPGHEPFGMPEGPFAYTSSGWFAAAAHPAQLTVVRDNAAVPTIWVGRTLAAGESLSLPRVIVAHGEEGSGRTTFRSYLDRHGRRGPGHVGIYDPYGWYQISHASEPKIELTDELALEIGATLERAEAAGTAFDFVSLDCGWNDPDDLRFFHPRSMPSGGRTIIELAAAAKTKLMLWASPSEGPRAFRHAEGLYTPGFEDCLSGNPVLPWRLCPAAPRWRDKFRSDLVHHATHSSARGFKIDCTDIWCNGDHDHLPGIWSLYATSQALADTFDALRAAGAEFIMLYWGLRSPWWLLWGDTLYDRGYLVEAAAPSGTRAWGLRSSVASSQDIGHQAGWRDLPPRMQDSLGIWISDTAWASWQGASDWADAVIMDIGRGSRLTQMWGNLGLLEAPEGKADRQLADLTGLEVALDSALSGQGEPVLAAAWEDGPYGYLWRTPDEHVAFVSNPGGQTGGYSIPAVPGAQSVRLLYASDGLGVAAELVGRHVEVTQSPGSVVVLATSTDPGEKSAGIGPAAAAVTRWERVSGTEAGCDADRDENQAQACYLGRGPQIQPWLSGEHYDAQSAASMVVKLAAADRELRHVAEHWTGTIDLAADGEFAVVVRFTQDGRAWHNDRLHELCSLAISLDGRPVPDTKLPNRAHEQAGSWTWTVSRHEVTSGEHQVELDVRFFVPATVRAETELWVRTRS